MTSPKVDLKRTLDGYQAKRGEFRIVDLPPTRYLMVDGHGDPNTAPAFEDALAALYPIAYALKFASKRELGLDYVVPPLEGLWSAADMDAFTVARDKSQWDWTLLLMVPDHLGPEWFTAAVETVERRAATAMLRAVRLETLTEGTCVQTLHIGPFDDEAAVLDRLHHEILPSIGRTMRGRHHEIYLSDRRRTDPTKLRTILRQPVD